MDERLLNIIALCFPVIGGIITGFIIPYIKAKVSSQHLDEIIKWVAKAVRAAEILFDAPKSGEEKRDFVIRFIDRTFNTKKTVITEDQIRILLEAACQELKKA